MKKAKKLFAIALVLMLLLPTLLACKVDVFPGGKDALFNEKHQPKSVLLQLLSSDKYKKASDFEDAFAQAKTPRKLDYELKINKLSIMEGMDLNGSNKLSGSVVFSDTDSEGDVDLAFMGNSIKAKFFTNSETLAVEIPEALDKYLKIPFSELSSSEGAFMLPSYEAPSTEDLVAFEAAIGELSKKVIDIIKANIPDNNIENKKETIEYGGKKVNADIINVKIDGIQLKKIVVDVLKYVKGDSRFEKILSAATGFDDADLSFTDSLQEAIEYIESEDDEADDITIELVATFVKSKLVAADMAIDTDEDKLTTSFKYEEKDGINSFIFDIKVPESEFSIVYTENTKTNEFKLSINSGDDLFGLDVTLTMPDDNNFSLKFKLEGPEAFEATLNYTIVEVTNKTASLKLHFLIEGMADVEFNVKAEILDSYTFNMPTLTADNSYDITDAAQAELVGEQFGEAFKWLEDLFPSDAPIKLPEVVIEYNETEVYETKGELLPTAFANILDGDGAFLASAGNILIQYYYKDDKVIYNYSDFESETFDQFYYDGQDWYQMDSVNLTLTKNDTVVLWLSELLLLSHEAEFVSSGLASDGIFDLYYEIFNYPTFDSEVCYLFDEDGGLLYVSDGVHNYGVMLTATIDDYIAQTIQEYLN